MEDSDAFLDQEYESLNDAILKAIVASKEVRDILIRLKEHNNINDKAVLNLFLSLDELHQMINEKSSGSATYKMEPSTSSEQSMDKEAKPSSNKASIIDGEALTQNEILFEKFYQGTFNETDWMKKARVRF